jgi:hypothetical protein
MKPLAARACARPSTAPSTMTLLSSLTMPGAPSTAGYTVLYGAGNGRVRRRGTVPPLYLLTPW